MRMQWSRNVVRLAACGLAVVAGGGGAYASCGESFSAIAAQAKTIDVGQASASSDVATSGVGSSQSIVGMWHVQFLVGGTPIQEAYQIWNLGGTEVHNPNVDPRGGNVCLGTWAQTAPGRFKLVHRVWSYDTNGNFMGTIHLTEHVSVGKGGMHHQGGVTLDFYDASGNFQQEVKAQVAAEKITAN